MVLCLADCYFVLSEQEGEKEQKALSFFRLCVRLPMVLQMILVKRAFFKPTDFFSTEEVERGLRDLFTPQFRRNF